MAHDFLLLSGTASTELTATVGRALDTHVAPCRVERFPDGEVLVELGESVRKRDVVLLQSTSPPVNDHLIELLLIADACRRAAASHITAVIPYFGYARSDRRAGRRAPVAATAAATIIESSGIAHVVTIDVHTPQLEGFFRIPTDDVTALAVLDDAVRPYLATDTVIAAPDVGAVRRARDLSQRLGCSMALCVKHRHNGAEVEVRSVVGDVAGRTCIIVDDMISTGATVVEAARALRDAGGSDIAAVVATHGVFAPGAVERLAAADVGRVLVTDTIAQGTSSPSLQIVSVAPLLANIIHRIESGESLRSIT